MPIYKKLPKKILICDKVAFVAFLQKRGSQPMLIKWICLKGISLYKNFSNSRF